jgi:hypothetical protein
MSNPPDAMPTLDAMTPGYSTGFTSCPGDPSAGTSVPAFPICPDINGNVTPNPLYPDFTTAVAANPMAIYPNVYTTPTGQIYNVTYLQAFCPEYCTSTRISSPAPSLPINAVQPVTSFQTASCPDGYFEVASYNLQPAIQFMQTPQQIYGPFGDWNEYNSYKNNSAYRCSIFLVAYNYEIIPLSIQPTGAPYYNTTFVNTGSIQADGNPETTCQYESRACYVASDYFSYPNYDTMIQGKIGRWVPQWTWTPYWNNRTAWCGIGTANSYSNSTCTTPIDATFPHYDKYYHYARFQRCQFAQASGWFYTTALVPATRVCARNKAQWMKTY